jgi:hypothetical protein
MRIDYATVMPSAMHAVLGLQHAADSDGLEPADSCHTGTHVCSDVVVRPGSGRHHAAAGLPVCRTARHAIA